MAKVSDDTAEVAALIRRSIPRMSDPWSVTSLSDEQIVNEYNGLATVARVALHHARTTAPTASDTFLGLYTTKGGELLAQYRRGDGDALILAQRVAPDGTTYWTQWSGTPHATDAINVPPHVAERGGRDD